MNILSVFAAEVFDTSNLSLYILVGVVLITWIICFTIMVCKGRGGSSILTPSLDDIKELIKESHKSAFHIPMYRSTCYRQPEGKPTGSSKDEPVESDPKSDAE